MTAVDLLRPLADRSVGQGVGTSTPAKLKIAKPMAATTTAPSMNSVDFDESSNSETRNMTIPALRQKYPKKLAIGQPSLQDELGVRFWPIVAVHVLEDRMAASDINQPFATKRVSRGG